MQIGSAFLVGQRASDPRTPDLDELIVGKETTKVLVEQLGAIDATRLGKLVGHVSPEEMWGIDDSLLTDLGLL